jgi:hypothetical protein
VTERSASADLQARTRVVAGDMTERVANLADGVTAAITKEAPAQGLTPKALSIDERRQSKSSEHRRLVHGAIFRAYNALKLRRHSLQGKKPISADHWWR